MDFFTPIVDDPQIYGEIAAANAISDVYAMGGVPFIALNIVGYHQGQISPEIMNTILQGGFLKAKEAGCLIGGGHTIQDKELKYGLAVSGTVHPERIWRNNTPQPGDVLVLTKPIGTGAVSTALKHGEADAQSLDEITASMRLLNKIPADVLREEHFNVHACTDITGYGLAGHCAEMLPGEDIVIEIDLNSVPIFDCLSRYINNPAYLPGGFYNNRQYAASNILNLSAETLKQDRFNMLFDPQTNGGLLVSLPEKESERFVQTVHERYPYALHVIGRVLANEGSGIRIVA